VKPPFGTLNATLAKTIAANAPKYRRIVEPFGDGGTFALHLAKRRPKEHVLNLVDPELFAAFVTAQKATSGDLRRLKRMDWVGSQEAFDAVIGITASEGVDALYRFLYLKKFGMAMGPDQPMEFDLLATGRDESDVLMGLPLMRALLKGVTVTNDDPLSVMSNGGSGTFTILLPKTAEDAEAVRGRLSGLSGEFFFAAKAKDTAEVLDASKTYSQYTVSALKAASIMMATYTVLSNYASELTPIDSTLEVMKMR
jgi:hypothetical protein